MSFFKILLFKKEKRKQELAAPEHQQMTMDPVVESKVE